MAIKAPGKKAIQAAVDSLTEFKQGNLRGSKVYDTAGVLPDEYRTILEAGVALNHIDFVVYSYATPVAWHYVGMNWYVPEVRYSQSTTNHQNVLRVAVANPGFYAEVKW